MDDSSGTPHTEVTPSPEEAEEQHDHLMQSINQALEISTPKQGGRRKRRPNQRWWTPELDVLRDVLHRCKKRKQTEEGRVAYVLARREYTDEIKRARRSSWRNFCSRAEGAKDVSSLIKILQGGVQRRVSLLKEEGKPAATPAESLDILMRTHFPNHRKVSDADYVQKPTQQPLHGWEAIIDYITEHKVRAAIKSFGPYKAPGPDGLAPCVLQHLGDAGIAYLTRIFACSVKHTWMPNQWRQMSVVFIPKEGKEDYAVAKSYRPITLSNFVLKTLERLLQWYLVDKVIDLPLKSQHAYTRGRSTDTALSEFVNLAERMTHQGKLLLAVGLDCSGAFDRIKFTSARQALLDHGVAEAVVEWYDAVLQSRQVKADLQGVEQTIRPTQGSPQGGILSPLVWNLIMDSLLTQFQSGAVKAIGYADDVLLLIPGTDPSVMGNFMQDALNRVVDWGAKHGLVFNPTKTQAVMFHRANNTKLRPPRLRIGNKTLDFTDEMKYLGLTVNKRLSWTAHTKERYRKCVKLLHKVKGLVGRTWGLSPDKLAWIYTAVIRPKLTYGALVWGHALTEGARAQLNKLQRLALLLIARPLASTATAALEVVLGFPPLHRFVEEMAMRARLRTRNQLPDTWDGCGDRGIRRVVRGHQRWWDDALENCDLHRGIPLDTQTAENSWLEQYSPSEEEKPDVRIFTDGSRIDDRSGYGWAATRADHVVEESFGYLGEAEVFQSEVTAISSALLWLISNPHKLKPDLVQILTDSQAAIGAIYGNITTSPLVAEAQRLMRRAQGEYKLWITWVPGHKDVTGNELADALAKQGSGFVQSGPDPHVPLSLALTKRRIQDNRDEAWNSDWKQAEVGRHTRVFMPTVNRRRQKDINRLHKTEITLLIRVITGHGLWKYHMGHWSTNSHTLCELCEEEDEKPEHFWQECPVLAQERYARDLERSRREGEQAARQPTTMDYFVELLRFFHCDKIKNVIKNNTSLAEEVLPQRMRSQRTQPQ